MSKPDRNETAPADPLGELERKAEEVQRRVAELEREVAAGLEREVAAEPNGCPPPVTKKGRRG